MKPAVAAKTLALTTALTGTLVLDVAAAAHAAADPPTVATDATTSGAGIGGERPAALLIALPAALNAPDARRIVIEYTDAAGRIRRDAIAVRTTSLGADPLPATVPDAAAPPEIPRLSPASPLLSGGN